MTPFYYHDQNPSLFCFIVQMRAFVKDCGRSTKWPIKKVWWIRLDQIQLDFVRQVQALKYLEQLTRKEGKYFLMIASVYIFKEKSELLQNSSGAPNENIVQKHLNIALLNVF